MHKLPIVEFRNSQIYNQQWTRPEHLKEPPSPKDWEAREAKLRKLFDAHGQNILERLSEITGLEWQEDRIIVYLTWGVTPFSDPVTISLREDVDSVFDTLTHELTHRIVSEDGNWEKIKTAWRAFADKYPDDEPLAVNHAPIHAIHELAWKQLFPKRVEIIKNDLKLKPYQRAWEIVGEIGAEGIVKEIFATS